MLNVKFTKQNSMAYVSHIDMQNAINRSVIRAGFVAEHSKGFNPHTLLKLSPPMPLGLKSEAEYFTLYLDADCDEFVKKFNSSSPLGMIALKCYKTELNPKLAGIIVASEYHIFDEELYINKDKIIKEIDNGFCVITSKDGIEAKNDCKDLIFDYCFTDFGMSVILASGNKTLRLDRFLETINRTIGTNLNITKACRTVQFIYDEMGKLQNVDDYLDKIKH